MASRKCATARWLFNGAPLVAPMVLKDLTSPHVVSAHSTRIPAWKFQHPSTQTLCFLVKMASAMVRSGRSMSMLVSSGKRLDSTRPFSTLLPTFQRSPGGAVVLSVRCHQRVATREYTEPSAYLDEEPLKSPFDVKYTKLLINGEFVDAASGKTFPTLDPRTGEVIAQVAEGDKEDVDRAVAAARKAFQDGPWSKLSAYERSKILLRFADLLEQHADELGAIETWDNGKPYEQAKGETIEIARVFRYFAGWVDKIHGRTIPSDGPYQVQTFHEPLGVVGSIVPWNFPLIMFAWKVAPALAAGNTVVLKTAEQTPLSAILAAKLGHEAGLPPGVLNIISGFGATAGAAISSHMDIDKVSFTGSTEVGKLILQAAAKSNLKNVTLELGGKSPFIVCGDADIDLAVETAHFALFYNQGQACCAGSRTFVHESVYDEFVDKAKNRALLRNVGDPFRTGTDQGPQVDQQQFHKILGYIDYGQQEGARLLTGGQRFGDKGYYIQPTVFADVKDHMKISREEIFGPVQIITKFKTLEEVIARANDTIYGLASGVFTRNLETANTLTHAIKAGSVWVNCYGVMDAAIPFGGYKQSGIGREKGLEGLMSYLQVKAVAQPLRSATGR